MSDTFDRDKEYKPYGANDPFKNSPFEDESAEESPEAERMSDPSLNNPAAWEAEGTSCCSSIGPSSYDPYCACDETEVYKNESSTTPSMESSSSMDSSSTPSPAAGNEHFVNPYAEAADDAVEAEASFAEELGVTEPAPSQWQPRETPAEQPEGLWTDLVKSQETTGASSDAVADDEGDDSIESDSEYRTRYTLIEARPGDWEAARSEAFGNENATSWRDQVESAPVETTAGATAGSEQSSESKPAETKKRAARKPAAKKKAAAKKTTAKKSAKSKTKKTAKKAPAKKRTAAKKKTVGKLTATPETPNPEGDITQPPTREAA
jgi:hypothetical protein